MKTFFEPAREIKVRAEVDILVVGGGPAGIMAAEAAAKGGKAKVMLIEQRGFLGGNLILGLPILSMLDKDGNPYECCVITLNVMGNVLSSLAKAA